MNLICYLNNGFPTLKRSIEIAEQYVRSGCDIIEIDFPAKNPFLEGEFIADRMGKALEECGDYEEYMKEIAYLNTHLPDTKFIILIYESTILDIGYERFVSFCKLNELNDIILVGLQGDEIKDRLISDGLGISCYVQFSMDASDVNAAVNSNGFVYMQGKPIGCDNPRFETLKECIAYLRAQGIRRPIYCGVGIHTPADAKMAKDAGADGVFVGSAVMKLHEDFRALDETIKSFKREC